METISIREASEKLGVSAKVVRRLIAQGTLPAEKTLGRHGTEWRVDAAAAANYRDDAGSVTLPSPLPAVPSLPSPSSVAPPKSPAAPPSMALDLVDDKVFLQRQVERLTALLTAALAAPAAPPSAPAVAAQPTDGSPAEPPSPPPSSVPVTSALKASLQLVDRQEIASLELCSTKLLWGRPVLWRLAARDASDISSLLEAIADADAAWDPPGEEVTFLWVRDSTGAVLWGTACGPGWFGPPFEEALRAASVERA